VIYLKSDSTILVESTQLYSLSHTRRWRR